MSHQTESVQKGSVLRRGTEITVVDTPDISIFPKRGDGEKQKRLMKNAAPDIVLVAVSCDKGYTKEDLNVYTTNAETVGKDARRRFVVAFTFGDSLSRDIKTEISKAGCYLKKVLKDAENRYVVFGTDSLKLVQAKKLSAPMNLFLPDSPSLDTPLEDRSRFQHREAAYSEAGATSRQRTAAYGAPTREPLRLLIVGEMGSGKSTLANMILHRNAFTTGSGMSEMTQTAQRERAFLDNVEVEVVDTPDIVNAKMPEDRRREVAKWVELTGSKPDAVILTIRSDDKYTPEKKSIYTETKSLLGGDLSQVLVLAFTFGDQQERNFERDLQRAGKHLHDVMTEADGRYVIFNAKAAAAEKDTQVSELIRIICALGK
ncbi:GTPase IMAP family member 4-like [Littorina saxatilis]|uniref:GTPase IMAP family member 4-like n=1 Tax=Littorina saxatilis TaxID=31220 RepID=UPI0038B5F222